MAGRNWTEKQKQQIINWYTKDGLTCADIGKKFGAKPSTISKYLKLWGVEINRRKAANRLLNESYFENIDTPEKAYILGLLFADGSIVLDNDRQPSLKLELVETDVEILKRIQELLNSNGKLTYNKRAERTNGTYSFSIRSQKIASDLSKWNIVPNKTYAVDEIKIPEKFQEDYLRGYIDGDGSIYYSRNAWHVNICGHSKNIIQQFAHLGCSLINVPCHEITLCDNVYRYTWNNNEAVNLIKAIYLNSPISIARKQEKAMLAIEDKQDEDIV